MKTKKNTNQKWLCWSKLALPISATCNDMPNSGNGIFNCSQNGNIVLAEDITVLDTIGALTGKFKNSSLFNIRICLQK